MASAIGVVVSKKEPPAGLSNAIGTVMEAGVGMGIGVRSVVVASDGWLWYVGRMRFVFGLGDGSHFVRCCVQRLASGIWCACQVRCVLLLCLVGLYGEFGSSVGH